MIVDVTNEAYTTIKNTLTDVTVLQDYPITSPSFPCAIVSESSNTEDLDTIDSSGAHYSSVILEVNIFSNKENKITQVKDIRNRIDNILSGTYRMTRTYSGTVPNYLDDTIYRYVLRYSFKVDSNRTIYRG